MEGLVSGEFHLYGRLRGAVRLRQDARSTKAWRTARPFERATSANLRFEGTGVRLDRIEIAKSTGTVTGAACVGWEGNYSFNADGDAHSGRVAQDRRVSAGAAVRPARVHARAARARSTSRATTCKLRVADLFAGDEGIGQVNGRLSLRGEMLTLEMEAASPRLVVSGPAASR